MAIRGWCSLTFGLCITACVQVVPAPAPEEDTWVPAPYDATEAPALEPTPAEGLSQAPSLDLALYYYTPTEQWYRWARGSWYVAFSWEGYWFPLPVDEVPAPLRAHHKPPTEKDVRKRLEELEKKLEELEP